MENIKLKSGVYAVVNTETGDVLTASLNLDHARAQLQNAKAKSDSPRDLKLAKMQVQKLIR